MKNESTINFGTTDLSPEEHLFTIGGNYYFLIGLGLYLYDNRAQFVQGLKDGIKDFQ